ncbi:GLPGLI family protein [Kordia antarctica]|nr:GLPGLI family protein [Kordia antarctica]
MKKIYLLFTVFCFFNSAVYSQSKKSVAGHVVYKFMQNQRDSTKQKNEFDKLNDELMRQSKGIIFNLKFKGKKSYFYIDESLENDVSPMGHSHAKVVVSGGNYLTDLQNQTVIRQTDSFGEQFLVTSNTQSSSDWTLTKETKMIGKYKCYKAYKTKTIVNPAKKFTFNIIAWYTPQIPVNFGIKEFNNLPGLILELQDSHFTFYVYKIKFLSEDQVEIPILKGEKITEVEYQKKVEKASGFIMLDNKN